MFWKISLELSLFPKGPLGSLLASSADTTAVGETRRRGNDSSVLLIEWMATLAVRFQGVWHRYGIVRMALLLIAFSIFETLTRAAAPFSFFVNNEVVAI